MADLNRPSYGEPWASQGEKLAPDSEKMELGWVQEMMPFQYENFLQSRQDEALLYLLQKGVPEYSPTQEYIANKSVVTYLSNIYVAVQTVTGVLPTVIASWKRINPIVGANGAVAISGGGTGATTAASARTNLGLGAFATQDLPDANGVLVKVRDGSLASRLLTGTTGNIVINNPDGVGGNPQIDIGANVVRNNADASWTARGSIKLPSGSTADRGTPVAGKIRFNTELQKFEGFNGTSWDALGASTELGITPLSGDGVQTSFALLTEAFSVNSTWVYVGGVYQNKDTYSIAGSTITFSEAPTSGENNIEVLCFKTTDLGATTASQVTVEDTGNHFAATTAEGVFTEIAIQKASKAEVKEAIAGAATYTTVPAVFVAYEILVTQPHLRKMVWDGSGYVRAPWHQPCQLFFSYDNPATIAGALPVRGDAVWQQAQFPDVVARLGLSGTGTFTLVEARGEGLRVLDNGRGVDVGRVLRSAQGDAGRELTGELGGINGANFTVGGSGALRNLTNFDRAIVADEPSGSYGLGIKLQASLQWPVANEFRMRNIAFPLWMTI